MTVAELIKHLQDFGNPDAEVVAPLHDYWGSYAPIRLHFGSEVSSNTVVILPKSPQEIQEEKDMEQQQLFLEGKVDEQHRPIVDIEELAP